MSKSSHVQELRRKHRTLSDQVEETQRHPGIDALEVSELKKKKLKLKEEISRLASV